MGEALPYSRKSKRRPSITKRAKIVASICAVVAVVLAFGGLYLKQQETLAANAAEAATYTPPPLASAPPLTRIGVIGDSYTGGSDMGGIDAAGWPELVEDTLADEGREAAVTATGLGGSGYVTPGPLNRTFDTAIPGSLDPATNVAVVFGSINDLSAGAPEVGAAANSTLDAVTAASPNAKLLVIGPAWTDENAPDDLLAIRDTLATVAADHGATFLDPVADRWFFDSPDLIGADGVHPTDEGHAYMAERIAPAISALLAG